MRSVAGNTIKQARCEQGLTVRQLAAECGVSSSFVSDIESDNRRPSEELIDALADVLSLDRFSLAFESGIVPLRVWLAWQANPTRAVSQWRKWADVKGKENNG